MKFKNLGRYRVGGTDKNMKQAIPLPKTPSGRTYRYSPNPNAHPRHFVLGEVVPGIEPTETLRARMKLAPRSHQTVCPYSGHIAEDRAFTHPDDEKAVVKAVEHAVLQDVDGVDPFPWTVHGYGGSGQFMVQPFVFDGREVSQRRMGA